MSLRKRIEALPVHTISGYEWECAECHAHFRNTPCWRTGIKAAGDGDFDSREEPTDHGALLDRAAVLRLLVRGGAVTLHRPVCAACGADWPCEEASKHEAEMERRLREHLERPEWDAVYRAEQDPPA